MTQSAADDSGNLQPPDPIYPERPADWQAIQSTPHVDPTAWIAPGAIVLGRVTLKQRSSVWYGCVIRGDAERIEIGAETNVQDGSILHVDPGLPCILEDRVTLGHRALVHAAVVEEGALIGIGAIVLSGARIGAGALIAAGAVVLEGTRVPPHTLWAGCPARQLRELDEDQRQRVAMTHRFYVNNAAAFAARFGRGAWSDESSRG